MPNPFNEFFGVGASLRATGLAARKARMDAGDGGSREGRGSATRDAWPLPLLGESAGQPSLTGSGGFFAVKRPPTKAQRREAGMARAESKQARAADPVGLLREQQAAAAEEEARLLAPLAAADKPGSKRKRSAIAAAVLHEDLGAADDGEFLPMPLSYDGKRRCNDVWARWKEFEADCAAEPALLAMWTAHMAQGYPTQKLTLKFTKWLLSTRCRASHASRRKGHEMVGRSADQVKQQLTWARNHVWPTQFAAAGFPSGAAATEYWRPIRRHVDSLLGGGGGGVQELARGVAAGAAAAQTAAGGSTEQAAAAGASAGRATHQAVRAATMPTATREHLNQTGEYILQDALLSEPWEVNDAMVLNAYIGFARQTGCRPGMAVNVVQDAVDPDSVWVNMPPLIVADLLIGQFEEALRLTAEMGGPVARWYMEVSFERVKGQYFAHSSVGTAITPDSDEALRLGTVGLLRLLLRTAAPRAVYAKLADTPGAVEALRRKVDAPEGYAGLELAETGYESWAALGAACEADEWVADAAALERPLFPEVDRATGRFLLGSGATYDGGNLGKRLNERAVEMGYSESDVGAWSIRKDACDAVAQGPGATDTMTAARVLGHRRVNSRTMDRVYRADLRRKDLGRFWRMLRFGGTEERARAEPLKSPSAQRVPAAAEVKLWSDLPADAPERAQLERTWTW